MHPHVRFFVMGAAVGVAVGGLVTSVVFYSGSRPPEPNGAASTEDSEQVQKLAEACVAEARRQCAESSHTGREEARQRDRAHAAQNAERDLAEIENAALASGTWAKAPSFRARSLVRRLPDDKRREFEGRIGRALDGGQLKLEEGAWAPGSPSHAPARTP